MTALLALFWRDLRRAWGSGALLLPVVFFLLVATAFPFAVGPDAPLLAREVLRAVRTFEARERSGAKAECDGRAAVAAR